MIPGSKIAWIVFVLLVVSLSWWLFMHESPDYESLGQEKSRTREASNSTDQIGVEESASQTDGSSRDGSAEKKGEGRELLAPTGIFLSGRVIDEVTKEPVTRFCINMSVEVVKGKNPWKEVLAKQFEDRGGAFFIPLEEGGRYRCWIRSSSYAVHRTDVDVPLDSGLEGREFALDPGLVAWGRVLDDATGLPVKDVIVAPAEEPDSTELIRILQNFDHWTPHARTDGEGCFRLMGLQDGQHLYSWLDGMWLIAAVHPDYAEGMGRAKPGEAVEMEIRLEKGHRFYGKVMNDSGQPAQGVMVLMSDEQIPMPRPVLTAADGSFRTAPCLTGPVFLYAGPPPGQTQVSLNFTEETKKVFMNKGDMEVNFGPQEDHVTWQGTLYNVAGKAAARGSVELTPVASDIFEIIQNKVNREVMCDAKGRFRIGKLKVGTYQVEAHFTAWASTVNWGKITFEKPGLVEKDIVIGGAQIRGVVVDSATGEAVSGKRGSVGTGVWYPERRWFSCPLDPESRFVLAGLPPGTYRLGVSVTGYPPKELHGFTVKKDQVLDKVRIELSAGGTLMIQVSGFAESDVRDFDFRMGPEGERLLHYGTMHIDVSGNWQEKFDLEPGMGMLTLAFKGLGFVERRFEIFPDQVTELFINRNELVQVDQDLAVAVTVVYPDSTPVKGLRVGFYGQEVPGLEDKQRYRSQKTDEEGRFILEGLRPGSWRVTATLDSGTFCNFPDLIIPSQPENPLPLRLVLPIGEVTGTLHDNSTGLPFAQEGPQWWLFLKELATSTVVCEVQNGHQGDRFTVEAVPAGEYTLLVHARGFEDFTTEPFFLAEGKVKDLGKILLEPCGILVLEVVDEKGDAIPKFELFCNGKKQYRWDRKEVTPGKYRYPKVPKGNVVLVIKAEGFVDKEIQLVLEAGKDQEVRVILSTL